MRAIALYTLVVAAACGNNSDHVGSTCDVTDTTVAESRIRRLTPLQYRNTVRDLFGDPSLSVTLHDDVDLIPSAIAVDRFVRAAETLGPRGVDYLANVPGCGAEDDACAAAFVDTFATRAFRRPLLDEERQWLLGTFATAREQFTFTESITILTQVVLASPQFLYLSNEGVPVPKTATVRRLDDYALASRLSYFLWNSMPDAELLAAAAKGELSKDDRAGLQKQAERMMSTDRSREMAHDFVRGWLQLDGGTVHFGLLEAPKDTTIYPAINDELRAAMMTEIGALVEKTVFDGGTVADLFTDTSAYVNGPLAKLYGVVGGPTSATDWQWVNLDPSQRAGLLTRAAFATVYSSNKVQSPIRRGTFVLRRIMCFNQAPPPPNVDNRPIEDLDSGSPKTIRQATEIRTMGAACIGCHSRIDPIGFAFEHYDAIGGYRDNEVITNLPLDSTGYLSQSGNADGPVANAVELSNLLAQSEAATDCLTKQWFSHAIRNDPELVDECTYGEVKDAMGESRSMRELLVAIVTSNAFMYQNPGAE
jgi:hypothetical protein